MEKKQGIQLNQAFGAVLTLVLVATLIIIAVVIFVQLSTSFAGTESGVVSAESIIPTDAGTAVAQTVACGFGGMSLTSVLNDSVPLHEDNFTSTASGLVINLTSEYGIADAWDINYTYTWGSEACNASRNMTTEFSNYTSLIGLVGTIIFLGLVIGILVTAFAFGGRKEV